MLLSSLLMAFMLFLVSHSTAQDPHQQEAALIDLRIDLAASKLELLDSRMKLLEEKLVALERKPAEVEDRIVQIESVPFQLQEKYKALDSLERVRQIYLKELPFGQDRCCVHCTRRTLRGTGGNVPPAHTFRIR